MCLCFGTASNNISADSLALVCAHGHYKYQQKPTLFYCVEKEFQQLVISVHFAIDPISFETLSIYASGPFFVVAIHFSLFNFRGKNIIWPFDHFSNSVHFTIFSFVSWQQNNGDERSYCCDYDTLQVQSQLEKERNNCNTGEYASL